MRHLDTLSWAFTFYGALLFTTTLLVGTITTIASLAMGYPVWVGVLTAVATLCGALIGVPHLLVGRGIRARKPVARIAGIVLGVFNHLVGPLTGLFDDGCGFFFCLGELSFGTTGCFGQLLIRFLCCRKSCRYGFLAFAHHVAQRWPDELHAEPYEHNECDRLTN